MFRMNEYHHPIDIQYDLSTYNLNATNIEINTLAFYFLVGTRSIAEAYPETNGRLTIQRLERSAYSMPISVRCNWETGGIYVFWSRTPIPDHEIVCSYEWVRLSDESREHYISKITPTGVNWPKEGF